MALLAVRRKGDCWKCDGVGRTKGKVCGVCDGRGELGRRAKRARGLDVFSTALDPEWSASSSRTVVLFYAYTRLDDVAAAMAFFGRVAKAERLRGRVLIAHEGVNANLVAPSAENMARFIAHVSARDGFAEVDWKTEVIDAESTSRLFGSDLVIKEVNEIVSTGGAMPFTLLEDGHGGRHYSPEEFHRILTESSASAPASASASAAASPAPAVPTTKPMPTPKPLVVIDVRNSKEYAVGHFEGAEDPGTKSHAEMAAYLEKRAPALKSSKVLMYCTGGIRCEKASALLKSLGVADVGQLSGGVVRYVEKYGSAGFFQGSNFVFDGRDAQRPAGVGGSSGSASVVGVCSSCGVAEEGQSSDRVCAVCRYTVLSCDGCRRKRRCVLFCADHALLDGAYFPFLGGFSTTQLNAQRSALACFAAPPDGAFSTSKAKRRTIANQIRRIDARCAALRRCAEERGGAVPPTCRETRCRCCGRTVQIGGEAGGSASAAGGSGSFCDGQCWGWGRNAHDSWRVDLDVDAVAGLT